MCVIDAYVMDAADGVEMMAHVIEPVLKKKKSALAHVLKNFFQHRQRQKNKKQ